VVVALRLVALRVVALRVVALRVVALRVVAVVVVVAGWGGVLGHDTFGVSLSFVDHVTLQVRSDDE
jgi:hypothetical protein